MCQPNCCVTILIHNHAEIQVTLTNENEYITGVTGAITTATGRRPEMMNWISFQTNLQNYGPFGNNTIDTNKMKPFSCKFGPQNQFGGFHGSFNATGLVSIGVYLKLSQPAGTYFPAI